MAHGWDSYFDNIPPLSSDTGTLRTSESEETPNIEGFIGHHGFSSTAALHEVPEQNEHFNTNYCSNSSIENTTSYCDYQRYCSGADWQAEGEQMGKDFLPSGDISDFATQGLSTSESFPSSFAADLQGIKDCGMQVTSIFETYSDVSSCSDVETGETRPSCKFMSGSSFSKTTNDLKNNSSGWFFNQTGNVVFPSESRCPNISEAKVNLPSNVKAVENAAESGHDKMESPEKSVKSCIEQEQASTTSYIVTSTENDRNAHNRCEGRNQRENKEINLRQGEEKDKVSDISRSGNDYMTGEGISECSDGKMEEQITVTAPNDITGLDTDQDYMDEKVLSKEMKELPGYQSKGYDDLDTTMNQVGNMSEGEQDKTDVLPRQVTESAALKNDEDNQFPLHSSNCEEKYIVADCEEKEIEAQPAIVVTSPKETQESSQRASECNSCDVSPVLQSTSDQACNDPSTTSDSLSFSTGDDQCCTESEGKEERSCLEMNIPSPQDIPSTFYPEIENRNSNDMCDGTSTDIIDNNKQNGSSGESSLQPDILRKDEHPCLEVEMASRQERVTSHPSSNNDNNDSSVVSDNKQNDSSHPESCLDSSSKDELLSSQEGLTVTSAPDGDNTGSADPSASVSTDIRDETKHGTVSSASSADSKYNTCAVMSDDNSNNLSNCIESCSQTDSSNADMNACSQKQSPGENTNVPSSPNHQQSLHLISDTQESSGQLNSSTEEQSVSDVLFGEPLSGDDSCDTSEINLNSGQDKETVQWDSMDCSEKQEPRLKSSEKMRKLLHPVVLLKDSESMDKTINSYQCDDCQHTTYSVDDLIEHHHHCHFRHSFQFCASCNLYLMNKQAKTHVCGLINKRLQCSSKSNLKEKGNRHGYHRCRFCGVVFSKVCPYIAHVRRHTGKTPFKCSDCGIYFSQACSLQRHIRTPGRCKMSKHPPKNPDVVVSKIKTQSQKELGSNSSSGDMQNCYVKLVDVSKTHLCKICGKTFSSAQKAKKHLSTGHKPNHMTDSNNQCSSKISDKTSQGVEHKPRGKHKCPLCPSLFKYSFNRARHLRDCVKNAIADGKGKIGGKYKCPLCHTLFTLASNRYRHIKTFCIRDCIGRLAKELLQSKEKLKFQQQQRQQPQKLQKQPRQTGPKSEARYKCSLCPAVYFHPSGKYRHMKKHRLSQLSGKPLIYRNTVESLMSKSKTVQSTKNEEIKDLKSEESSCSVTLSCRFCGKCFDTLRSLKNHEHGHRGERPYRCLECKKGFKKSYHLISHKSVHQKRIQCTVCRKILPSVGELIKHRSTHLKKGMLKCPECPQEFQFPVYLLRHLDRHRKAEKKAAQVLEKDSSNPQQPVEIVKKQNLPKQLQCSLCKEVFENAHVLRKHCLTHISGSSSNQCPFCKCSFTARRGLLHHMVRHTGDKPFSCNQCGKQFYRKVYLNIHTRSCSSSHNMQPVATEPSQTKHPVTETSNARPKKQYSCSYCPRKFSRKYHWNTHIHAHKANRLRVCSGCGQHFGTSHLTEHQTYCVEMADTSADLPSSNDNSNKSVSQTSQIVPKMPLQSNMAKLLKLKCPHCSQRFRYRSLLLRHIVSHTGLQPYPCVHCGHRFSSKSLCLQHEVFCDGVYKDSSKHQSPATTHQPALGEASQKPQGEPEYKCKFCTKTFMKPRSLRLHILTHNEVKPYRCKACDSCFSRYDHLKVHQACCKGKKRMLEVCIPKISLDDVGTGWQNKYGIKPMKEQETFKCSVCSKTFPSQSNLLRHVNMFHKTKLFSCTACGSEFSHKRNLKRHMKLFNCGLGNPKSENVTEQSGGKRNHRLQKIEPYCREKYKYFCNFCPRGFKNNWQLGVHTRLHTGERPYRCDCCGERFIRKDYLQRHIFKCPKKQLSKVLCDRCGMFFSANKIERHKKACILSSKSSTSTSAQKQSKSHSQPKGFSCAYCSCRFLIFSQLQEHFLSAHKMETIVPPMSTAPLQQLLSTIPNIKKEPLEENTNVSSAEVSNGANLTCKLETNKVSELFVCPHCNMSFASKAGLCGHIRIHTGGHYLKCKICKRPFQNKSLLRNHYRKCRKGGSTTQKNDSGLLASKNTQTTATGTLETSLSFPLKSEENQGESSSSKERKVVQYQCSECDKSFTDGLLLISHLEDHGRQEQEKKRNTCTKCGRVCSSQVNLERHMKMHGIETKYTCKDCSKVFSSVTDFENHRKSHNPDIPFPCQVGKQCHQRFWTRAALYKHYNDDHPNDVFQCQFCSNTYAAKKSLVRHHKKSHQKEVNDQRSSNEQQTSSQHTTTGDSDENETDATIRTNEDSDSDSAPYFPCHVCGKTFPTSESLEDHQLCHLGEKPHECAECGKCFFQASQLQQHQRMHKSEFQCQTCGRGFVSLFALRKHKHSHGKSRPHRCSKCHLSFASPSQLAEHMSTHREENFPCDICNRVFLSKSSRAEHRKGHTQSDYHPLPSASRGHYEHSASLSESSFVFTAELKYRCGICCQRFKDPEELSEHGCEEAKGRPYSCTECNIHFLHVSHLQKHKDTHHQSPVWPSREYSCNHCNRSFSTSQQFLSHLKSHVANDGRMADVSCPVCHKCFASTTELICHFSLHVDGTADNKQFFLESNIEDNEHHTPASVVKYECSDCDQIYMGNHHHCPHKQQATEDTSYTTVETSSRNHYYPTGEEDVEVDVTGEELYNCPMCPELFSSQSSLLEHQNAQHANWNRFPCEICGKTFAKRRYLKEHERRHRQKEASERAPYKCIQCTARFSTVQELSVHVRQHAEKDAGAFRCDMCYKSFSHASLLKQHRESHVGEVVYECTECDKAFAFPHLLEEHQQTHAGSSQ